jgi:hypothetical protein
MLLDEKQREAPGASDAATQTQVWRSIWSLPVPTKVRHFLWRACHDSLPTQKNLHHRHVLNDPRCPNCSNSVENTLHALLQCKSLQMIWQATPWGRRLEEDSYVDFMELYYRNMQTLQAQELQLFAMITWSIWYRRNRQRLDQPTEDIARLLPRAFELLTEFHQAQEDHSQPARSTEPLQLPNGHHRVLDGTR